MSMNGCAGAAARTYHACHDLWAGARNVRAVMRNCMSAACAGTMTRARPSNAVNPWRKRSRTRPAPISANGFRPRPARPRLSHARTRKTRHSACLARRMGNPRPGMGNPPWIACSATDPLQTPGTRSARASYWPVLARGWQARQLEAVAMFLRCHSSAGTASCKRLK